MRAVSIRKNLMPYFAKSLTLSWLDIHGISQGNKFDTNKCMFIASYLGVFCYK
jgi:hypothetical protein